MLVIKRKRKGQRGALDRGSRRWRCGELQVGSRLADF
jgi:hypothetical protein